MDAEILSHVQSKVREVMDHYGIHAYSYEPIEQQIVIISDFSMYNPWLKALLLMFGLVHNTFLAAGSDIGVANAGPFLGSYATRSNASKRVQSDYTGLAGSSKKRKATRRKFKNNLKPVIKVIQDSVANGNGPACESSPVDKGMAANHGSISTRESASDHGTVVAKVTLGKSAVSSMLPEEHSEETRETTAEASPPGHEHNSDRPVHPSTAAHATANAGIVLPPHSPLFPAPNSMHCFSTSAMRAIESILLDCVKLNYAIRSSRNQDKMIRITTRLEQIRRSTDELATLEFGEAMRAIKRGYAICAGRDIQARYNETVYWDIILNSARALDPAKLPNPKGPQDEFSRTEKEATRMFMAEAGYGLSSQNQRRCRRLWKSLSEMRKAGVDKVLCYRTKDCNVFFNGYSVDQEATLLEVVQWWEKVYGPQMRLFEIRIKDESEQCSNGRFWLDQQYIAERLDIPKDSWNNSNNAWHSPEEKAQFEMTHGQPKVTGDQLGGLFDIHIAGGGVRNSAIFVSIFPRGETDLIICPVITVQKGDFLGTFAGKIRYSGEFDDMHGIPGPEELLWLDYSRTTGTLNLMRVSMHDSEANVSLEWELCSEKDEGKPMLAWRVSVRARRMIEPFEELTRVTRQERQSQLHLEPDRARKGYMKSG